MSSVGALAGRLLISETKRLLVLTPGGDPVQLLPLDDVGALSGVAVGPKHVYVADSSTNTLRVFEMLPGGI